MEIKTIICVYVYTMWQAVQKYFMYKANHSPCLRIVRIDIMLEDDPLFMAVSTMFTM
jgi:hypothetical protein